MTIIFTGRLLQLCHNTRPVKLKVKARLGSKLKKTMSDTRQTIGKIEKSWLFEEQV